MARREVSEIGEERPRDAWFLIRSRDAQTKYRVRDVCAA